MPDEEIKNEAVKDEEVGDTSSPSASEEEPTAEADVSKAEDTEAEAEDTGTSPKGESRAARRIRQLVEEKKYWESVAKGEIPSPFPEAQGYQPEGAFPPEEAAVDPSKVAAIARQEAEVAIQIREAEEKFPELKSNDRLAAAVIGAWNASGRTKTIAEVAKELQDQMTKIGKEEGKKEALASVAEKSAGASTPSGKGKKAGGGWTREAIASLSPEEYEKHRDEILRSLQQGGGVLE